MLDMLLESSPRRARGFGWAIGSLCGHVALIGLAIAATAPKPLRRPAPDGGLIYIAPPRAARPAPPASPRAPRASADRAFRPLTAPPIIPTELPPIDPGVAQLPVLSSEYPGAVAPRDGNSATVSAHSGIYSADVVEKAAEPQPGNAPPRYPESLRSLRIEGEVVMRFIVDTLGVAERGSVIVLSASHPAFAQSVKDAIQRSRYFPALIGNRPVRQLVEQRFMFALR